MTRNQSDKLSSIPTNIITGFLGVGKTTAILNLLKNKPTIERWAVLVNEFGEIGIDGSLIAGQYQEQGGVFIREVPGGCMCCAAGLPMQIALNQLLAKAKPDRLLIEPTGLGHPKEVLNVLLADHNRDVLQIQKCITLVDARKIADRRYATNDTFNQQIEIADIVVANKSDLYVRNEVEQLRNYIKILKGHEPELVTTTQGQINTQLLQGISHTALMLESGIDHLHPITESQTQEQEIPDCGYLKIENSGEGYNSIGWRFSPDILFNKKLLYTWLCGLEVERMKGVFITEDGVFAYNIADATLTEFELDDCLESRVEIISATIDPGWESELLRLIDR